MKNYINIMNQNKGVKNKQYQKLSKLHWFKNEFSGALALDLKVIHKYAGNGNGMACFNDHERQTNGVLDQFPLC